MMIPALTDMQKAARFHRSLIVDNGIPASLLGGCWLSWMSDLPAKDWDFFAYEGNRPLFEKMGYSFVKGSTAGYGQSKNTEGGFVVSKISVFDREQIILTSAEGSSAWMAFDYLHVMLGVTHQDYHVIDVGLPSIRQALLTRNVYGQVKQCRTYDSVFDKLNDRPIWGKPAADVDSSFRSVIWEYLTAIGKTAPPPVDVKVTDTSFDADFAWDLGIKASEKTNSALLEGPCYVCGVRASKIDRSGIPVCGRC